MRPQGLECLQLKINSHAKVAHLWEPVLNPFIRVTDDPSVTNSNGHHTVHLLAVSSRVDHFLFETHLSLDLKNIPSFHLTSLISPQPLLLSSLLLYNLQILQ